jgi:hypothetical protein
MKEGDLVRFVGDARFYKGRIGVVCRLYSTHNIRLNGVVNNDSALVYYAGAEKAGRALQPEVKSGLHPMGLDELEVVK